MKLVDDGSLSLVGAPPHADGPEAAVHPPASPTSDRTRPGREAWEAAGLGPDDDPPPGPDLAPWKERIVHGFALVFLAYALYYLHWRWTASLNPDALWFSVALAVAETVTLLSTFFFVFNVWKPLRRRVPPTPPGLSVDVFVTTYDEPIEVIRKTAAGAAAIRYPHDTWLLDDGRREEVKRLAEELGIGYLTREDNRHAKAGNLNNALRHTSGEFILQLDADHVPLPNILDRLLGYFRDPKLAFVQSPQSFYNTDSFTCRYDADRRRLFTEQSIFFRVIQPGKDRWNAAFFCGSCAVIRRAALDELGGFSTETVTEDFETSLRLHAAGWRSAYHAETLAWGLAPTTAAGFHTQRLRWAQGTMQVWRKYNPLTLRGLTLPQRICHFYSILVYLDGLPRIVFNLAPLVYLFLGVLPIATLGTAFIWRFLPIFLGSILLNALLGRGTAQPFWLLERSNMTKAFTHSLGLVGYFTRQVRFKVTPKGRNRTPTILFAPHLGLMVVAVGAVVWGTAAFKLSWIDFGSDVPARLAFLVNVGWAAWNFAIAWAVVRTSITASEERVDYRFPERLDTWFTRVDGFEDGAPARQGVVLDLNASGMTLLTPRPLVFGSRWRFHLPLAAGAAAVRGTVVRRETERHDDHRMFRHGISFEPVATALASRIDLHCTHEAVVFERARMTEVEDLFEALRPAPFSDEIRVTFPAELHSGDDRLPMPAVLDARGRRSARFISRAPVETGAPLSFQVPDSDLSGHGRVTAVREIPTALAKRYVIDVALEKGGSPHRHVPVTPTIKKVAAMLILALTPLRRLGLFVALLAATVAASASSLSAQSTFTGGTVLSGELTQNDRSFVLAGGWLTLARTGWSPAASVIGYQLRYPSGEDRRTLQGLSPSVGARHAWTSGDVQGMVGYAWQWHDEEEVQAIPGLQRVSEGVTTALQANYWGDGSRAAQVLASYSWGGDGYFWSRARGARRIAQPGAADLRLGAEFSAQGSQRIEAWEVGPALELGLDGQAVVFATGFRRLEGENGGSEDLWYARVDLVLLR